MKSFLALALFVGVALGAGSLSSTGFFGWSPNQELVYRFESEVLSGLPEIRRDQYAGLKIASEVLVQTKGDYSLIVKFAEPKFIVVNGELRMREGRPLIPAPEQEVPEHLRRYLTQPFLVHLKRGIVERFFVEENEPVVVTNIKKSLLAQVQMDLTASRRQDLLKTNMIPTGSEKEILEGGLEGKTFFTTEETTLNGDCQVDYNMWPMPKYQSNSLEAQWTEEEKELRKMNVLKGIQSQGEEICRGKQYWTIVKTENFDNCRQRPVFVSGKGAKIACEPSKAECKDIFTMTSSSKYIVCGTPERFTIREIVSENTGVFNPLAINTEKTINNARVTLFLVKAKTSGSFTPLTPVSGGQAKEKKSLIMEYPLKSEWSSESSVKTFSGEEEVEEFTPLRPVPSLHTPDFVYPSSMTPSEIKQEVIHKMEEIVNSIYSGSETENSGMGSKTAAKIGAIVTELRYLNSEELRSLVSELESILSNGEEVKKVIGKQLLHDILSTVGTNPAVILVKEELQRGNVHLNQRIQVVQTLIRDVRTPTKEILKELVHLVKTLKGNGPSNIFYTAINQLSTLFYRACVDTSSAVSTYPVRIYGRFCTKESSVLTEEYIPYLTGELERVESRGQRLAILSALGKTGSKKALLPITKAIEGHSSTTPIIRSLAVYSLRRIAKQEPTIVKPIILALIDNLAENTEVRIAAVSVLPYCQPSVAELQKIAIRSWFEPSKQVTSFIYSTLKGLPETEVPELKPVGLKCKKVLSLVKPSQFGIQFSHNTHFVNFIKSLRLGGGLKTTMVKTAESLIPSRTSVSFDLYGAGIWEVKRLDHTIYTQGMDTILEKVIALVDGNEVSSEVESELRHIKEKLNIKPRGVIRGEETPEIFSQFRMFDLERISHIKLSDIVEEVASNLRSGSRYGSEHVTVVGMVMPINGEILMPTIAGFPLYLQTITPLVYGSKTTGLSKFSSGIAIKAMPTSNLLVNSNIGVRCPLTKQFIGSGVEMSVHMSLPLEVAAEINNRLQLAVTLKAPKEVRGDIELLSTKVHAYTVVKDCKRITTVEEATNLKEVRTGKPVHKMTYPIGHKAGIHSKVEIATDYKVYDFAYIMNLIKEEGIVGQGLLPKTLKYFNTRITFNPALSDTKEIKMTFNMVTGRTTESGLEMIRPGLLSGLTSGIESGIESGLQSSLQSGIELESLRTPEGIKSEIHSICKEHHTSSYKVERCIAKHEDVEEVLSLIQTEKNEIEEICGEHGSEEEKLICRKGLKVCHKAKVICEEQSSPLHCAEKKDECIDLKRSTEKMMVVSNKLRMEHELEQGLESGRINGEKLEGLVSGIAIHTSLKQEYGNKKSVNVVLVGGYTQKGRTVRTTAELVCKAFETPRFEVELLTTTRLPEVLFRWNLPALLEQPIEMSIDAELKFGRVGEPKTKVAVHSLLEKSEQQKKEVRASPEYKKCEQEERESRPLSPVCMETRHQAASVDFIRTTVLFPSNVMERSPLMTKIGNGLKSTILSNLVLFRSHGEQQEKFEESTPYYPGSGSLVASGEEQRMTVETIFSRDGSAANLTLTTGGSEQILLRLKNVRVPQLVSGLMPLSVRNGITTRLVQKVSRDQAPASCSIDHSFVNTFDNRTYGYKVNECEHLLFKDCSGMRPVAVTASKVGGNSKKVTVLAGSHKVVMKPSSALGGAVDIFVDGRLERISHNEEYTKVSPVSGKITLKIYRHKDGVVSVTNPIEKLTVFFDNKRIEIVAPQRFHNRACGLCGDLNQENTADLKSPEKCLFSKDRFAAYSYSMKNERCSGVVPSEDKSIFEHELRECVKGRTVITPVTGLSRRLLESSPKPTAVRHLIHEETNRVCLSKKLQKVCPSSGPGSRGSQSAEVTMPFTCFTKPSSKAEQLVKRADAGEVLSTVMTRPTMFSKKMVITLTCGEEPFLSGKAVFGGVASGNYRTSERRGF